MIEPAIPGKETVRITLPTRRPAIGDLEPGEGGRTDSLICPSSEIAASPVLPHSDSESPWIRKNGAQPDTETSRISVLPTPVKASAGFPALLRKSADNRLAIDAVPKSLCWVLVGVSAGVLLVEIWNYIN